MSSAGKHGSDNSFEPLRVGPQTRVFILTGAGISAESGIRTFRDQGGLWEQHRIEQVATPGGFASDPRLVWRFYSERRTQAAACAPNPAHLALGRLGDRLGDRLLLCTQNVDDLHEKGGSRGVLHMHGELFVTRCEGCDRPPFRDPRTHLDGPPGCERCGGRLRPHIVWFGEVPFELERIFAALEECDLFVTIGSSGAVYPAAGFISHLRNRSRGGLGRVRTVYVGLERPSNAADFDEVRLGKAGEIVPTLFEAG
jgi:NAD-dependent deacetylase